MAKRRITGAAHARASNSRLTRSSWRTWPQRKLRRKVPRVDDALTTQPRVRAVPPVRNASASSMQSPPVSAEATSVSSLSPVLPAPARRRGRGDGRRVPSGPGAGRGWPAGAGRHWPPGGGHQRRCGSCRDCSVTASCILTLARDNSSYVAVRSAADRKHLGHGRPSNSRGRRVP